MKAAIFQSRHGVKSIRFPILTVLMAMLLALSVPVWAEGFTVSPGLTAHWYNPDRSGEGLVLEVLGDDSALVYWFTYDEDGNPRWLIDVGEVAGSEIIFDELTVSRGGEFGPGFDPNDVEYLVVGEAVLSFSNCEEAEFSYRAFGQAQTLAMTRLTETMATGCTSPNGKPGYPAQSHAGQTGSWYDPSHTGEGYALQWMSRNQAVLVWFSYDDTGNQFWMIGTGELADGSIVFPTLQAGSGAQFGEIYNPDDVVFEDWGTLTLTLDCSSGNATYESIDPSFGSGNLDLERLSSIGELSCPWSAPKFSDLYTVDYEELPLHVEGQLDNIQPRDIATTGRVVALNPLPEDYKVLTWMPGDDGMTELPETREAEGVLITPDGSTILAHDISPNTPPGLTGGLPMVWDGSSWSEYPNLTETNALVNRFSQNGEQATGMIKLDVENARTRAWRLGETGGQEILPIAHVMNGARGQVVSDDGRIVVGHQLGTDGFPAHDYATIWKDGGEPEILRDSYGTPLAYPFACDSECSIIAGGYQGGFPDPLHPNFEQAWIFVDSLGVIYLPRIEGAVERAGIPPYVVQDSTADGSMIVGRYLIDLGGILGSRAFIWTQHTGMLKIGDVFEEYGVGDEDWFRMDRVRVTPDGQYLLISGFYLGSIGSPQGPTRAVVLRLSEK